MMNTNNYHDSLQAHLTEGIIATGYNFDANIPKKDMKITDLKFNFGFPSDKYRIMSLPGIS